MHAKWQANCGYCCFNQWGYYYYYYDYYDYFKFYSFLTVNGEKTEFLWKVTQQLMRELESVPLTRKQVLFRMCSVHPWDSFYFLFAPFHVLVTRWDNPMAWMQGENPLTLNGTIWGVQERCSLPKPIPRDRSAALDNLVFMTNTLQL